MSPRTRLISALGLALLAVSVLIAWWLPPDGQERSAWLQVAGRFHPLAVHLPIGLLLLVPVMEGLSGMRRWEFLRSATGFVTNLKGSRRKS
ncbi:MAG: hypothetical protein EXS37_04880 [Opitutus sp.]|nr:hypothetical protein [Opitutus sp.]